LFVAEVGDELSKEPLMLKLFVPLMGLVCACADNLNSGDRVATSPDANEANEANEGSPSDSPTDARAIDAQIFIDAITCDNTIARFEAEARYVDDNSPAVNIACNWTFDDGSTSNECAGEHLFDAAGAHDFVVEVTDLDTGASDIATQTRLFDPPLELTLDVTGDDQSLSIMYAATSNTGGLQAVTVTPSELVVADDPNYPQATSGTVRVLEHGTYTVTYYVEDERGVSEICSGQLVEQVTLACKGDHPAH
jgi:hypothetical protein